MTRPLIPFDIGTIHFIGIGGIGMSGMAEILHTVGYKVQGSDIIENKNVKHLKKLGVPIKIGQVEENLRDENGENVAMVVASAAIPKSNLELKAAKTHRIPIMDRAQMLGELMRLKWSIGVAGTHGKTTTTTMVSALLDAGSFDPTVINGGIVNAYGTNARYGEGDWLVAEACEAYGSIKHLRPTIAIVTNIDPEHLDYYGTFDNLKKAFHTYLQNLPFYGFGVVCIDHPEVQSLIRDVTDRSIYSYGTTKQADVRAENIRTTEDGAIFDIAINGRICENPQLVKDVVIPMPGRHNVLNALAAITVVVRFDMDIDLIKETMKTFSGVKRRFTKTGDVDGVTIIDDYGHHPVEISAVLKAARETRNQAQSGKVIAVFQPHRYTRLDDLFDQFCTCFNDADTVLIADVYRAGEEPIENREKEDLVQGLIQSGHRNALTLESRKKLAPMIADIASPNDIVICLGAGSISLWANELPSELAALKGEQTLKSVKKSE